MGPYGSDAKTAGVSERGQIAAQLGDVLAGIGDVPANFSSQLDDRLVHLRLDLLLEHDLAALQDFLNVRTQLARLWIDDGKLLLDPQGEDMRRLGAHKQE